MQIRSQQLCAFDVVPSVQLLIDAVRRVCRATHWQQKDVLARRLLKGQRHGDTESRCQRVQGGIA